MGLNVTHATIPLYEFRASALYDPSTDQVNFEETATQQVNKFCTYLFLLIGSYLPGNDISTRCAKLIKLMQAENEIEKCEKEGFKGLFSDQVLFKNTEILFSEIRNVSGLVPAEHLMESIDLANTLKSWRFSTTITDLKDEQVRELNNEALSDLNRVITNIYEKQNKSSNPKDLQLQEAKDLLDTTEEDKEKLITDLRALRVEIKNFQSFRYCLTHFNFFDAIFKEKAEIVIQSANKLYNDVISVN